MLSTVPPFARRRSTVCNMSSVMTGGRPPWFPLRAAASSPSRVDYRSSPAYTSREASALRVTSAGAAAMTLLSASMEA